MLLYSMNQFSSYAPLIFQVNASDSRGKADGKIEKGIGGSTANSIKELVSNEALTVDMDRLVLIKFVLHVRYDSL